MSVADLVRKAQLSKTIPNGYMTIREFAEKVGHNRRTIYYALERGRIDVSTLIAVDTGDVRVGASLYIHESQIEPYLNNRSYVSPNEKERAKNRDIKTAAKILPKLPSKIIEDEISPEGENSAAYWKTRKAKVSALKEELELKLAKNEVMEIEQIKYMLDQMATTIRQSFLGLASVVTPKVAGLTDPRAIQDIIDSEIRNILADLSKIENLFSLGG